jgi:hydrogenase maturation protease
MSGAPEKVLIIGVGNELLGDEGLGVHVARSLLAERASLPPHVDVLEAGTSLLDFLPAMPQYSRVIIVDAVRAGQKPGTVYRAETLNDFAAQLETSPPLSLHQWSLFETLRAAENLRLLPKRLSLVGAEPEQIELRMDLSPELKRAAARIISLLLEEVGVPRLSEQPKTT